MSSGGTALPDTRRFPLFAMLAVAVVGAALIILVGVLMRSSPKPAEAKPQVVAPPVAPTPAPGQSSAPPPPPPAAPKRPDPLALASNLERALRKQRLWSTVEVIGARVEVRSGSCADPAMTPVLDGAAAGFKAAGLTKLRCLEQSGRVVSDRDL